MTAVTKTSAKEILGVGASCRLYKLTSVSQSTTLTTDLAKVWSVLVQPNTATVSETYVSYTLSTTPSIITFYPSRACNVDVLVWGE